MKPVLFEETRNGIRLAHLVDADSVFIEIHNGKQCRFYRTAINIFDLKAGHLRYLPAQEEGEQVLSTYPKLCCLALIDTTRVRGTAKGASIPVENREFAPEAARALLSLASKGNAIAKHSAGWDFKKPTKADKKNAAVGQSWKLLAAWRYSLWEKLEATGEERHADMERLGYSGNAGTLRTMVSRLGLVTK